jgi:hypothetical protein
VLTPLGLPSLIATCHSSVTMTRTPFMNVGPSEARPSEKAAAPGCSSTIALDPGKDLLRRVVSGQDAEARSRRSQCSGRWEELPREPDIGPEPTVVRCHDLERRLCPGATFSMRSGARTSPASENPQCTVHDIG